MLNLVIDIGNTRTKIAIFDNEEIIVRYSTDNFLKKDIADLIEDYPKLNKVIVSSVKSDTTTLIQDLNQFFDYVLELNHHTNLPIKNLYKSPETLGKDRIAAAVGANKIYPSKNLLIIDAGTAITYDFVNDKNEYFGGFISMGLNMRFKALNHFTDKLPLLKSDSPNYYNGDNTENSIKGGVQYGLEGEFDRIIEHYSSLVDEITIILTGGDVNYFEKLLKNHKFVRHEITLLGLNTILGSNYIINTSK